MKLSIIIPVYNEAPWLRRCLDSIKPSKKTEVIIIDDCSTDGSAEICDEYADRFIVHHQAENRGVSVARNTGIQIATADHITFIDSDDYMSEDGIKNLVGAAESFPEDPIVQLNHLRYYTKLDKIKLKYSNRFGWYGYDNLPIHWCMVWNKVYDRNFIINNNIEFVRGMQYGEDAQFNLECLLHTDHIQCTEAIGIVHCFDNKNSLVRNITEEKLTLQDDLFHELIRRPNLPPKYKAMMRGIIGECWNSATYQKIFTDEKDVI